MNTAARTSSTWIARLGVCSILFFAGEAALLAQPSSPPSISSIASQGVYPNATSRPIAFVVGDAETPAAALVVSGVSANTNLIPNSGLLFGGAASNRTVTITPAPGQTGSTTITITVTDTGGGAASNSFVLDVAYFTSVTSGIPLLSEARFEWGDYDNDGLVDLLANGHDNGVGSYVTRIYHNLGNNTFADINVGLTNLYRPAVSWADYDRDGYLDVLVAGGFTQLYHNEAGSNFVGVTSGLPDLNLPSSAWGDVDNDGDLDVVLTGTSSTGILPLLYRNNGDGTFTGLTNAIPLLYLQYGSADWGDFDNDGDLDLLIAGREITHVTKVYRNDGRSGFAEVASLIGVYLSSSRWGDYDNDGDLDILLTGGNGDITRVSRIYRNNGDQTFTEIGAGLMGVTLSSSAWGDFDNDGDLDAIVTGLTSNSLNFSGLYRNNGNQTFTLLPAGLTGIEQGGAAWADTDNDGDLDLLLVDNLTAQLYRNNASSNSTPAAPVGQVNAQVLTNNEIALLWSVPADAQTPGSGLNFNLRLGTTPGGGDVVAPQANPSTGLRRLAQFTGMHTNRWRFRDLPVGTYYWAVQAIDTAMAGSPFSSEQTFSVTNSRPVISPIPDQVIFPGQSTGPLPFTVWDAETPASNLVVAASSSNTLLVPQVNITLGGSGTNRTINLTPAPDQTGNATITIAATDSFGVSQTISFKLSVVLFSEVAVELPWPTNQYSSTLGSLAWFDVDADNDLDLWTSASVWDGTNGQYLTQIGRNTGNGATVFIDPPFTNLLSYSVVPGDFNNDGYLDAVISASYLPNGNWTNQLLLNQGGGTYVSVPGPVPPSFGRLTTCDFDNDGRLDLFASGTTNNSGSSSAFALLFRNTGGGTFATMPCNLPALNGTAKWADFNNDGLSDVLLTGYYENNYSVYRNYIYRNLGGGQFQLYADLSTNYASFADAGDYDADGDQDLLLTYPPGVYRNNGGGSFTLVTPNFTNAAPLAWGDFDNDGDLDLLCFTVESGTYNRIFNFYRNDGLNMFVDLGLRFTNTTSTVVAWTDYDKDGDLDFISVGSSKRVLYRNNTAFSNAPPAAPTGLLAEAKTNNTVQLTWQRPTDPKTPAPGLSYDLRIGTTPGGVQIASPPADVVTGFRRVTQPGLISNTNRALLVDLPPGTYYWSVQAVDAGFAGGPFAAESSFTVTRPVITEIPDQLMAPGFSIGPLPFQVWDGETAASSLVVTATWSNLVLVPPGGVVLGGSGTNRTITITPTAGQRGTNVITLVVTDAQGNTDSTRFTMVVEPLLAMGNFYGGDIAFGNNARVVPLDSDNDGWLDVFLVGSSPLIFRNTGNRSFVKDFIAVSYYNGDVAWADYDNDNDLDLATSDYYYINRNDGTNHFTPLYAPFPTYSGNFLAWGDWNGDGRQDLFDTGYPGISVSQNNGDGTFTLTNLTIPYVSGGAAKWGDLDNDGDLDLFLAGYNSSSNQRITRLYANNGTGVLMVAASNFVPLTSCSVDFGDYDQDGDLDILFAGSTASTQTCRIYRNDGGMNFTDVSGSLAAVPARKALWGDFDNDGDLDILVAGANPTTVYLNSGGGFTPMTSSLPAHPNGHVAWGDFDHDGDLDVAADFIYFNTRPVVNQPPQPPGILAGVIASNQIALTWSAGTDDHTSSNGLTYNLRLGTTPGGIDIISPQADFTTGYRRLVAHGNSARTWILKNPPDGNYYWSVQSIDAGFASSTFAPEAALSYFHPTISGGSNLTVYPGSPPPVVAFVVGDADSAADSLVLSGSSSNPGLLDPANIVFSGSGSNRTATLNLTAGVVGTSVVSVVVTDLTGLTATSSFIVESVYFSDVTPLFAGGSLFNGKWGDYDNDDDLDLFMAGAVYRNDGDLLFTKVADLVAGARNAVAWGDYDHDGDLDLAIAADGFARVYRNNGSGAFANVGAALLQGLSYPALAWGDYDHDGRLDLVLAGYHGGSRTTVLYHNNLDGTFSAVPGAGLPGVDEAAFAWGDFDNDGRADLLVAGGIGPSTFLTEVYRNNGNGTFTAAGAGMIGIREGSVAWGDADNDGDLDALVTGFYYGSYILNLYRNNGNGTFTDLNLGLQGTAFGEGQFVDFDNDGWLDVFVCGCIVNYCDASIARIYRNNHDGTFSDANIGLSIPSHTAYPGSWGDFDKDGDLDLILDRLYRNMCNVSNSPPTAPFNLVTELLPDNNVRLRWDPAGDAQNSAGGLSYAVRVGSTPGGTDYVAPHANAANGFRRLPERGPVQTNQVFLRDVPRGAFYWSVHAIDAGLAGSPFALEGSFTITNARPLISAISNQVTAPGRPTPPIHFTVSDFETVAANLALTGSSANAALVPNANIVFGGAGSNRTVTLTPTPGMSGTATLLIGVTDEGGLTATAQFDLVVQSFTAVSNSLPSITANGASAWGDYDKDGDLDIALAGQGVNFTTVYRNNNGVFTNQNFNFPGPTANDLAWVDYDRDGDLDLTGSGWLSAGYMPTTFLFRNNSPSNTFTSLNIPGITNIADGSISWADYDNDGDVDLLLSGDTNTYHLPDAFTALYRNDGGVFTNSGVVFPALVKGAAAWGDYDNDGDLDVLMAGQTGMTYSNAVTKLFRNNGNGAFTEVPTALPRVTDCALTWGDCDNDGDLDVLIAGMGTNSVTLTRIYRNVGNGVFTNTGAILTGASLATVAWGDYDNDGYLDAVVGGSPSGALIGSTRLYHNNAGASFTDTGTSLPGLYSHNESWGDHDNDGDLDLLIGSRIYRNEWNIPNTPPSAPTNLAFAITSNNDVRLSWSPSTDAQTTDARGLNYNLRVGTSPGGAQIVSPQSDPANGYRRAPNFGNAGQTNFWRISNLTNGTYYWSVQAIDGALAGSAFAGEATFTLSRPVISAISNRTTLPNTVLGPINFTVTDAETAAADLIVTASSSDTNLVPAAGLALSGVDSNRSLTITPVANRSGPTTISIVAVDESGQGSTRTFLVTVERFADIGAGLATLPGPLAWGDFDNDGDLDIVKGPAAYRNSGNNLFTNLGVALFYNEGLGGWSDYDGDGNLDLLAVGANASKVYRTDGNGAFTDIFANLGAATLPRQAGAWGDFDNDGDPDIVLILPGNTRIYRNNGTNFTDILVSLPGGQGGSVAWGDYDKDGDLDLLIAGNGMLRIYRNNGNGMFTDLGAGLPGAYEACATWGDFDNDGDLDFAVVGSTNNSQLGVVTRIYRNTTNVNPALAFTNLYPSGAPGLIGVWKGATAWGDFDNDGDLDLLITGEGTNLTAVTRLFRNDNGSFVDSGFTLPGLKNSFAAWGDFNNDGLLDLALSGTTATPASFSAIFRNFPNSNSSNAPPNAPSGLTRTVVGKSVRLSWAAPTDPNQAGGLSYNLRLGTAPGAGNIVSPLAVASGARRVVALGNANERLTWTITNLTGGTFYWSVQAIDHSFAGSAFAAESSFFVSNRPPSAITRSLKTAEDTMLAFTLTGSDPDNDPLTFSVASPPLFGQVVGVPPNVIYRPATNYFGFDQFTFIANDRTTDSPPAAVFLEVTPVQDVSETSLAIQRTVGGQILLTLSGEPWKSYRLEASEDLKHWVPVSDFVSTNLLMDLIDADAPFYDHRFYRAALRQPVPAFGSTLAADPAGFSFVIAGEPGRNYQVQTSSNLFNWMILTNVLATNSLMPFVDRDVQRFDRKFYRLVAP